MASHATSESFFSLIHAFLLPTNSISKYFLSAFLNFFIEYRDIGRDVLPLETLDSRGTERQVNKGGYSRLC